MMNLDDSLGLTFMFLRYDIAFCFYSFLCVWGCTDLIINMNVGTQ